MQLLFWTVAITAAAAVSANEKNEKMFESYFHQNVATSTAVPTAGDFPSGFVYVNYYAQDGCAGEIVATSGRPTNKCIVSYDDTNSGNPTGSFFYSCSSSGEAYVQQFTDAACTQRQIAYTESLSCRDQVPDYASALGHCNKDPSQLPLPTNGNYSTQINYDSPSTCADTIISTYEGFKDGFCFNASTTTSVKYSFPEVSTYTTGDCSGTATTTTNPETCTPITTYPLTTDEDKLASRWATGNIKTGYVYDKGYVYFNYYQSPECENQIVAVLGNPTDVCLLLYENGDATPTGSHMYTCDPENSYEQRYTDNECTVPDFNVTKSFECMSPHGRYGSGQGVCNTNPNRVPLENDNYVTELLFNQPGDCTTEASFSSFLNNECLNAGGGRGLSYSYPTASKWNDISCLSLNHTYEIPAGCQEVAEYPAETAVASQWYFGDVPGGPSASPTAAPTLIPTPSSYGKGYVSANFYDGAGCTGKIVFVTGHPTETCLKVYDSSTSAEPTGSVQHTCVGSQSVKQLYSDLDCQVPTTASVQDFDCQPLVGGVGSFGGSCNSDPSKLPLPYSNFTTQLQYDSPTSCDTTISWFQSWQDGHCFDKEGTQAYMYDYPVRTTYDGFSCVSTDAAYNVTLSGSCDPVTTYPVTAPDLTVASKWVYGNVNLGDGSNNDDDLSTAAIAGIAAGGAVAVVAVAAGAYFFLGGAGATATASATTGAGASAVNPLASAV